jgi:hypothetical protein
MQNLKGNTRDIKGSETSIHTMTCLGYVGHQDTRLAILKGSMIRWS